MFKKNEQLFSSKIENYYIYAFNYCKIKQTVIWERKVFY